ncbi:hypothetical protein [Aquimarina brevivitae]|uniref:Uncharacterized protein n=1 Tax=Aquimarina brevivitae TaxID=323412 RepID=A0A4Q7PI76_9FLAO|nr:hypothetical protein [Aquimarina brevivitae]RZT00277.1 hypothetical protein EV197_1513 [Aquimarina brevivitae]
MFDSLSEETQLLVMVLGLALLFILVMWNTKRNSSKFYGRKKRDFRKNVQEKKKNRDEDIH